MYITKPANSDASIALYRERNGRIPSYLLEAGQCSPAVMYRHLSLHSGSSGTRRPELANCCVWPIGTQTLSSPLHLLPLSSCCRNANQLDLSDIATLHIVVVVEARTNNVSNFDTDSLLQPKSRPASQERRKPHGNHG